MKKYIHYGHKKFDSSIFATIKNRPHFYKPAGGMWASPIDAEYGWKDWCKDSEFVECENDNSFSFTLQENARIYHIYSISDVKAMPHIDENSPDFEKMLNDGWDAIELHLSKCAELYFEPYGWDCDCILIMNKDIVELIEHLPASKR